MACCSCFKDSKDKDEEEEVNNDLELQDGSNDSNDILAKNRSCTDIICLTIFIFFVLGMFAVFILSAVLGDPYRLLNGYDVSGDVCGSKNGPIEGIPQSGKDLQLYKYIYFISNNEKNSDQALVKNKNLENCLQIFQEFGKFYNPQEKSTNQGFNSSSLVKQSDPLSFFIHRFNGISFPKGMCRICVEQCPEDHSLFLNRCVPSPKKDAASQVFSASGLQGLTEGFIADIEASWREVIYMCLIALGFSIIMSLVMRFFVGFIVYIVIGLVSISFVVGTVIIWILYALKKKHLDERIEEESIKNDKKTSSELKIMEFIPSSIFQVEDQEELNWILAGAIILTIVTVILLLVLLVLRSRIQFVIQLFKEASRAIQAMPFLVLQPFWTFSVLLIFLFFWTLTLILFESSGYPEQDSTSGFVTYRKSTFLRGLRWYNFFGLFWISQFIIACQHVVIAGAISTWFFTRNKSNLKSPILKSIYRLMRYHLGSVALGSFIIALIKFVRAIMTYFQEVFERMDNGAFKDAIRACFCCCQCLLWLFEKVIKFINRRAYIEITIHGYNFCKAAKRAFNLTSSNILRIMTINMVGDFVLFLTKVAIVAPTVLCGIHLINKNSSNEWISRHIWAPVGLGGIFSYIIACCFISVYEMAIDTTFICFCEDSEINNGESKPYFMNVSLMNFVSRNSTKSGKRRAKSITEVHPI